MFGQEFNQGEKNMRTTMILLAGMLAALLLASQAPAWQGGNMERGTVTSVQQSY